MAATEKEKELIKRLQDAIINFKIADARAKERMLPDYQQRAFP